MDLKTQLNTIIKKHDLLTHPFYQAWNHGTLTKTDLQTYASEYGTFIKLLPKGWSTLRDRDTAQEEQEHFDLWKDFATSINTKVNDATLLESKNLVSTVERLFADPVTTLGAMYAFEVQQPKTAQSKRQGLQTHYGFLHADEKYFEVHSHNEHESEKLFTLMSRLTPREKQQALDACSTMCQALWDGLSGVYKN